MFVAKNTRKDVVAKVTGQAVYANDIRMEGMLHLALVLSPIPSGEILSIALDEALASPGVEAVFTAKDIPGVPSQKRERPVLCSDRVRYIGDAVAMVAAGSPQAAQDAAKRVKVEYRSLPALLDPELALEEDAPQVHEGGNLICRYVTKRGNVEDGLKQSPHVLERVYTTQRVQHVCMETEACVASYDPATGQTLVRCPVNSPFAIRKVVADTLGCPLTDVRVALTTIGGSFGGKNYDIAMASSRAALASRLTGRPCKMVLTREESITEGTKRHPLRAKYTVGFDDEGKLIAEKIDLLLDGGAYTSKTHPVTSRMAIEATGPYYVPNVDTRSVSVYTNNVYSDALRGFGSPQVDFCSETLMDEIAAYLKLDPLVVRRRNMLREGGLSSFGQTMRDVTLEDCLQALEAQANLAEKRREAETFNREHRDRKKGVGMALLHRGESFGAAGQGNDTASGAVSIQPDGSVTICSSIADVGQGGPSTMVNLVHRTLGVEKSRISIAPVDTAYVTDAGPTVATRGTVFSGNAVNNAALELREKLARYAAQRLGTRDLLFEGGRILRRDDPERSVTFLQVVQDVFANCDHLNALGYFTNPPLKYDKSCGVGEAYMSYVYGASAATVTVDLRTGSVSVDEFYAVHDVGCALDMDEVKGQIIGGVSMGVGYATLEEVELREGRIRNLNLENYLIPTVLDMPQVTAIVLEKAGAFGPHGAKGLGEPATSIVAPAIVNAISAATGRRIRSLPANLERVALNKNLAKGG